MQRADTLRYLVLLVKGGIYSDTDTRLRKPPSKWGQGATLWADGKGLKKEERARIAAGEKWQDVLGPPTVIVGIEADVGERDDWNEWWPRPVSPLPTEELTFGWNTDIRSK
jgi:alpha 1,6-mannosyltransferase